MFGRLVSATLLVFAAGASGGLAEAAVSTGKVELETLSIPAGTGRIFTDATASGQRGTVLNRNAALTLTIDGPTKPLTIRARGDRCGSAVPQLVVRVDGKASATLNVTATTAWATLTAPAVTAGRSHRVDLAYANDVASRTCDRALRLDLLTIVPAATATRTPTPTPFPTPARTPTPAATSTPTGTPVPTATASPTRTPTPTPTTTTAPVDTPAPTPTPTATAAPVDTPAPTPTPTAMPTTAPETTAPPTPTATPTPAPTAPTTPLPSRLYAAPNSSAAAQADQWRSSRPADADLMDRLAAQPTAMWVGDWFSDPTVPVRTRAEAAAGDGSIPTFVLYAIPGRDCNGHSSGGLVDAAGYATWIGRVAAGIGARPAIVVLEPDALGLADCLDPAASTDRYAMLRAAVHTLHGLAQTRVYLDAGHAGWKTAPEMGGRLTNAGIDEADGFALNVSNFGTTADQLTYGRSVAALVGGKPFVVDTSRNGSGPAPDGAWCNPPGRSLGERPTLATGEAGVDAFLWVKVVGESDGACNGGPAAGVWWPEYALDLARRTSW